MMKQKTIKYPSAGELAKFLAFAVDTALAAGEVLIRHQRKLSTLKTTYKKAAGMVSNADIASEALILQNIRKVWPAHGILAEEESWSKGKSRDKASPWLWVIDPLDGTHNFLGGLDYYAVCIALAYCGQPVVGVVYRPATGEMFLTMKGKKSRYVHYPSSTAKMIYHALNSKKLSESLLVTGFKSEKGVWEESEFVEFKKLFRVSRGIRRMGSAALDICYVALGIFDGFWERGLAPWDVAAAGLIASEAGAIVTDFKGCPSTLFDENILVARRPLHSLMRKHLT
jgi:myo-inositol-1(or 4)-monophosphatase